MENHGAPYFMHSKRKAKSERKSIYGDGIGAASLRRCETDTNVFQKQNFLKGRKKKTGTPRYRES